MTNFHLNSRIVEFVQSLLKNKFTRLLIALVFLLLTPVFFPKKALFIFFCLPIYLLIKKCIDFEQIFKPETHFLYLIFVCLPGVSYIISQQQPQFSQPQIFWLRIAILLNMIFVLESIIQYTHHFLIKLIEKKDDTKKIFVREEKTVLMSDNNENKFNYDIIYGSISIYLLYGIFFFFLYLIIGVSQENAFCSPNVCISKVQIIKQPFDLIYFSFKTLTTVGYGDIYPAHIAAKIASNLEGILGVMFPTIFIARLVDGNFQKI
ncbi:MAG: potassium channel family protein [Cyanobacteria bacterium P01_D01_bin.50]